jgi:16S rRNA (guanine(966)-N(2))-methyltransferase RsmD
MRIQHGKYKGRILKNPKNPRMRPTSSIAKKIIFNLIDIKEEDIVLDIFAGTGSLGLESLSLGAKKVIFSDNNKESIKTLKENLETLKMDKKKCEIYRSDFRQTLKKSSNIDILFVDPPFSVDKYFEESLELIHKKGILSNNGIVILEKTFFQQIHNLSKYEIIKEKQLGGNQILILKIK